MTWAEWCLAHSQCPAGFTVPFSSLPNVTVCTCHHSLPSLPPCPLPPHPALCPCSLASLQILWTFSIYLESVAILPQLFMVSKTGEAETITSHYLFALGVYRTLYLFNWIWRYHFEGFFDLIAIVAGLVQTVLYCDFFYLYITKGSQHGGPAGKGPAPVPLLPSLSPALYHSREGELLPSSRVLGSLPSLEFSPSSTPSLRTKEFLSPAPHVSE